MHTNYGKRITILIPNSVNHFWDILISCSKIHLHNY